MSAPWRWLKNLLSWLLALIILFEEWGWVPLARALAWLGRLPIFAWIERRVQALPPYAALALFALPTLALLPVKLLALWFISVGRTGLGLLVIVLAKVVGTAVVARLFMLTQPALMQLAWFARWYAHWIAWKTILLAEIHASKVWRGARALKLELKRRLRRFRRD